MEEAAVRVASDNPVALDVHAWLAYRLHALAKSTPVPWPALKGRFGAGCARMGDFEPTFLANLGLALAVYRHAKVEVDGRGLVLRPPARPCRRAPRRPGHDRPPAASPSTRRPSRAPGRASGRLMAPGALDPLTKEMLHLAASATAGCAYCTASHTASARAKGMTQAMYGELLAVVGMAAETNRLAEALRVPLDPALDAG